MHTTAEAVGSTRDRGAVDSSSSRHAALATTATAASRGGGSCSTGPASPRCRPRSRQCLALRLRCCSPLLLLLAAAAVGVLCCSAASSSASSAAGAVDVLTLSDEEVEAWHTGGPLDPHPQGEEGEEAEEGEEEQPQLIAHRRLQELMSTGGEDDTEDNGRHDDDQRGGPTDGTTDGPTDGDTAAATALLHLDELPLDELDELEGGGVGGGLNGTASSRKLMSSILAGPLPGLHFVPRGFPSPGLSAGGLGLMARLGAFGPAGAAAAAAGPGGVGPAAAAAGVGLASYVVQGQDPVAIALRQLSIVAIQAYGTLKRLAKQLDAADAQAQQVSYAKFLTAAASAWTSWFYGIQYRFATLTITLQWGNDPIQFELNRVLYRCWWCCGPRSRTRRRGWACTSSSSPPPPAPQLGGGGAADGLLAAARQGRDNVIAALRPPLPGGGSNVAGLWRQAMQARQGGGGGGMGQAADGLLARMQGLAEGASNAGFFSAQSG